MIANAVFSNEGARRTVLSRLWSEHLPILLVCMLNPSTASATADDATIRRLCNIAKAWGFGGIFVVNLYSLVSTDPAALWQAADPIGPDNDAAIEWAAQAASTVLVAWGTSGHNAWSKDGHNARAYAVTQMLRAIYPELLCLGLTEGGRPRHPIARVKTPETPLRYCAGAEVRT